MTPAKSTNRGRHKHGVIGLTGSIGSGKSTAASLFQEMGAVVIDADCLAHRAVEPGSLALIKVIEAFGKTYISEDGSLLRKELSALIFSDPKSRLKLEEIVHPEIRRLFTEQLKEISARFAAPALVIYSAPLLFESRQNYPELQYIVLISASRQTCIRRVVSRDHCPPEYAARIYDAQLPREIKELKADFIIKNEGSLEELGCRVKALYNRLVCAPDKG